MDITLEKIDKIRERTGIGYKEAKEVLERHNGDLLEALIDIEGNKTTWSDNLSSKGDAVMDSLKEVLRKGNVTKIVVKKDGNIIMNIPATAGAIGAIISLPATAIGLTAAMVAKCSIEITKEDGEIINISEMAEKTVDKVKKGFRKEEKYETYSKDFSEDKETKE